MFVDLMNDIYNTFSERFLKVQLVFEPPRPIAPPVQTDGGKPKKRYNALGILEDVEEESTNGPPPTGTEEVLDVGPDAPLKKQPVARKDPVIVGAGRARTLAGAAPLPTGATGSGDWSSVGRNDPCPCGSGKKFKKCHGAAL